MSRYHQQIKIRPKDKQQNKLINQISSIWVLVFGCRLTRLPFVSIED